ncbi:uncharacterized protein LODBEIA_P05010 [Lodderomyces beijingensis]|uniref:Pre-rRNA-processing protein IPI3 n=1 Tax=Lodderomyces beijingensis TaxID=1775926 RepID=A0ABP0ZFQ9_9ASCO
MDEVVFYISQGDQSDSKKPSESFAHIASIHSSKQYESFRHASSPLNGTSLTGIGSGERVFTCDSKKALINVYAYGKEGIDQKIPVPEALTTLHIVHHPETLNNTATHAKPSYRVPWLLCGGSKSGKLYIWELASGDLLCVKEAHYSGITKIESSSCRSFLVTGGEDARVLVWNLSDLIGIYGSRNVGDESNGSHHKLIRPYWSISDNTLAVTDVSMNTVGNLYDLKLYTTSKDSTVRIYDMAAKQQLTTFILPEPVECLARDPANRQLYVGLSSGLIKVVPLYKFNSRTSVFEAVGGLNKIVTVDAVDPNLLITFVQHEGKTVCQLCISMDGTSLVSGDDSGRVFVSDIVTKQTIKSFPELTFPISDLSIHTVPTDVLVNDKARIDKKHSMIPPLKRVLTSEDPADHVLFMDTPQRLDLGESKVDGLSLWLEKKRAEELQFKNLSDVNSTVKTVGRNGSGGENTANLEMKLKKVSEAYTDLRSKHEELIKEHAKLLDKMEQ